MWWAALVALMLVCFFAALAASFLLTPPDQALSASGLLAAAALCCAGFALAIVAVVLQWIIVYRSWAQIQDGHARTTPVAAVGFCFIPVFGLYWIFVAFRGLAVDTNAFLERHGFAGPRIPTGLALFYCILGVCLFVPFLNMVAFTVLLPVQFILLLRIANSSAAIAEALTARAAAAAAPA